MKSTRGFFAAVAIAASTLALHAAAGAAFTVDNFEEYTNGQDLGSSATSTPWRRYGAVEDDFFATAASAQDGNVGGEVPVDESASATIQRHYTTGMNFSAYSSATVLAESVSVVLGNIAASTEAIQLSISDGNTTYLSNTPLPVSGVSTSYTFGIDNTNLFDADDEAAPETLAQVLANASFIGFRISSTTGTTSERVGFDDFVLNTPAAVPEPATVSIALIGVTAMARRRRHR